MARFNTDGRVNSGDLYPCHDRPAAPQAHHEHEARSPGHESVLPTWSIAAMWSREQRPPRKGEWYLSGNPIGAYQAPNDLTIPYPICHLVRVEKVVTYKPTPFNPDSDGQNGQ
jgi:hypothetical protein